LRASEVPLGCVLFGTVLTKSRRAHHATPEGESLGHLAIFLDQLATLLD